MNQSGAGSSMTLIGSLFQLQNNGTRQVGTEARVNFAPAPSTMSYDLLMDSGHEHLTTTSAIPTKVTADLNLNDNANNKSVHGVIDKLPSSADLDITTTDDTHRAVSYSASAAVANLSVLYQDTTLTSSGPVLNSEIVGAITNLPTGVSLTQTGARSAVLTTTGGAIGVVEGGFAVGQHVQPVAGTESGALVLSGGGKTSIAARLRGLSSASFDASNPYTANVTSVTQPLHVVVDDSDAGRLIDAKVLDLPSHVALMIDPDNGHVTYDGFGQTIGKITADITSSTALFGRVKRLHADLNGIPTNFDLKFTQAPGAFSATLDHPVTRIDATADDGVHTVAVPGTDSGAGFRDLPTMWAAAIRIYGLTKVSFVDDPTTVSVSSGGGHVFDVDAKLQADIGGNPNANLNITARIDKLPSSATVGLLNGLVQDVVYSASDPIDHLSADVTSDTAFFTDASTGGGAKRIHADLHGIPTAFDLSFGSSGGRTAVTMDHPVTQLDFTVDDGVHQGTVPGTLASDGTLTGPVDSGVAFRNVPGEFSVAGRIYGLKAISFQSDPVLVDVQTAGGHVFDADAIMKQTLDNSGEQLKIQAEVANLPADVTIGMTKDNGTKITYDGHGERIARLEARAWGPLFVGRSHYITAKILDLPTKLTIKAGEVLDASTTPPTTSVFSLDTFFQTVGTIEVQALDSTASTPVSFPLTVPTFDGSTSSASDGIVFHDLLNADNSPKEWTLAARIDGIRGASVILQPHPQFNLDIDPADAAKFGVDVQMQSQATLPIAPYTPLPFPTAITKYSGYVDHLPPNMSLDLTPTKNKLIDYGAGAPVSDIFLRQDSITAGGESGVTGPKLKIRLQHVPTVMSVCTSSGDDALNPTDGCARNPRPGSWPAENSGDNHQRHSVVLNVEDGGSSNGTDPLTIDAYICIKDKDGDCRPGPANDRTNGARQHLTVTNFKVHNLYFDAYVDTCYGLLVCGHLAMDTRGQELTGEVHYYDSTPSAIESIRAGLVLPSGFSANNRYTDFDGESFFTGSYDDEYGSANCPSGTDIPVNIDYLGGGGASRNFAPDWFCHH